MFDMLKNFANAVRSLSIDMTNEANSGHQGTPLGFADVISVLFNRSMKFKPNEEARDRLILSSGHACALLYSAIYLTKKTQLSLDDLKKFRKFGGICQGHPELNKDLGIEMTTGALGQGIATSVGFAIALKKKNIDSKVFAIVGDGCLMEGVSHEAMTLASSLKLSNLIVLFDNNDVCIDGKPSNYTTDNIERFKAYGFNVLEADGHNYEEIYNAIESTKKSDRPSFISFKTKIGIPSKNAGTNKCHGKFISPEEAKEIRNSFGFQTEPFSIPNEIFWEESICSTDRNTENFTINTDGLHSEINKIKKDLLKNPKPNSTRSLGGIVFGKLCEKFPLIIGGSADLSESNCTISKTHLELNKDQLNGNYIHYGVREHAMGCIMNGLAIEGFIPYGGTFLVFSDYMKPAIRNAALMKIAPIFVLTHDSIAVGEDGGTHQPIEQLTSLRLIPNLNVMRPCCDIEVAECIELAIENRHTPTVLALSRQNLDNLRKTYTDENLCQNGMYEICPFDHNGQSKLSVIATGSEVSLALNAKDKLTEFDIRVISAPCLELFDKQPEEYKSDLISGRKLFLEAGSPDIWYKYKTQDDDIILGIDKFGESGSASDLFNKFGFTVENIEKLLQS